MPNTPDEVKAYLREIGRKGGKKSTPPHKYKTEAERLAARKASQQKWRKKQKEKKNDTSKVN